MWEVSRARWAKALMPRMPLRARLVWRGSQPAKSSVETGGGGGVLDGMGGNDGEERWHVGWGDLM